MYIIKIIAVFSIFIILYCSALRISTSEYYEYYNDLKERVKNKQLAQLMNGQLMDNLPNINLFVNNHHDSDLMKCTSTNALFLRDVPDNLTEADVVTNNHSYDSQCQKICKSGSAKALVITDVEKQEVYMNNTRLNPGIWCVGDRPQCNLRTTYAVITASGDIVCRSKFPDLFGGPTGDKVIACNNHQYYNRNNKLIDNRTGQPVDPKTVYIDKNKPMSEQFTCEFGRDDYGNYYIKHPLNPFHPFRNPCAVKLTNTDLKASDMFNPETGECDCTKLGSIELRNALADNKRSTCTGCRNEFQADVKMLQIESECFNMNDPAVDARHKLPCFPDKIKSNFVRCDLIKLGMQPMEKFVDSRNKLIEFEGQIRADA
uniref:Putative per os infectivity factor PIF-2 n=1 Tax=Chelonus inanitus TaxID=49201 RepID=B9W4B0_9HYME|nr:putative per os infectivity factor PIF-2 [Chelonus inanitus]